MNNIKKIFSAVLVCILLVSFNAHAEPMENISFADINEVMSYANEYVTWEDLQKLIDVYNRLPDIVRNRSSESDKKNIMENTPYR